MTKAICAMIAKRKVRGENAMKTDIHLMAKNIFHHVEMHFLSPAYAIGMSTIVRFYGKNTQFRRWVKNVPPSRIQKMLAVMVRECAWRNEAWLAEYIKNRSIQGSVFTQDKRQTS
ncbi:hypothetical protein [Acidithiobacillus sp. HP-11]|nr:hypothetical protein [Acidithiobacillus sp. HP-11]MBE7567621.1 hypothetical protein [Acidithiobacillus sp. HP-11]